MAAQSRREFLAAGVAFISANAIELDANPLSLPLGSQIYPLRSMLKDFPAFVKMMAGIGVTRLELCSPDRLDTGEFKVLADGKEVKKILADHGLKAESCHFSLDELRNRQQKCIEWAKEVGVSQMPTNSLGDGNGDDHPTMDQVKKAADEYNRMTPNVQRLVGQLAHQLNDAAGQAAGSVGKQSEFESAMQQWRQAAKMRGLVGAITDKYGPAFVKGALGAAGAGTVGYPIYSLYRLLNER